MSCLWKCYILFTCLSKASLKGLQVVWKAAAELLPKPPKAVMLYPSSSLCIGFSSNSESSLKLLLLFEEHQMVRRHLLSESCWNYKSSRKSLWSSKCCLLIVPRPRLRARRRLLLKFLVLGLKTVAHWKWETWTLRTFFGKIKNSWRVICPDFLFLICPCLLSCY